MTFMRSGIAKHTQGPRTLNPDGFHGLTISFIFEEALPGKKSYIDEVKELAEQVDAGSTWDSIEVA
eukprot:m.185765 g.185765  ORF g.185765 m.185765 type:complete len:66 (-) comp15582_c0_seq3:1075-1272(-)